MSKFLVIVSLFVFAAIASATTFEELSTLWSTWKAQNEKTYSAIEEAKRFAIFADNHFKVIKFNEENDTPKLALNKFADLTASEFKSQQASCAFTADEEIVNQNIYTFPEVGALPAAVDWRNKGAVTPVKDQGQCGSCWSFSTTGVVEGNYFLQNNELLSFSEQQIVDCDTDQNEGCNGGWPYLAVEYAAQKGLELEKEYPYTAQDGTCKYQQSQTYKVAANYSFVTPKSTLQLKSALVNSPVSVVIEADQDIFQFYSTGVIHANCGASTDHAVLAVGYDKVGLYESFIVKNSWGSSWGKDGYVWISDAQAANSGLGVCGILTQPVIATN